MWSFFITYLILHSQQNLLTVLCYFCNYSHIKGLTIPFKLDTFTRNIFFQEFSIESIELEPIKLREIWWPINKWIVMLKFYSPLSVILLWILLKVCKRDVTVFAPLRKITNKSNFAFCAFLNRGAHLFFMNKIVFILSE